MESTHEVPSGPLFTSHACPRIIVELGCVVHAYEFTAWGEEGEDEEEEGWLSLYFVPYWPVAEGLVASPRQPFKERNPVREGLVASRFNPSSKESLS